MPGYKFDAFLSYSTLGEYWLARRVESFLEGLHATSGGKLAQLRPLEICRDGSDLRQRVSPGSNDEDAIWARICASLTESRRLVVLCSADSAKAYWVNREVRWMLEQRGKDSVLLVVAAVSDPVAHPEQVFAEPVIAYGLHRSQLWYDVRAWRGIRASKQRDATDELVRLALDLLEVEQAEQASALAIWQRESVGRQRKIAAAIATGGVLVLIAAGAAGFEFWKASRSAHAARAASIVRTAQAQSDTRIAALLFAEVSKEDMPANALGLGHVLLDRELPLAVLRGHTAAVVAARFRSVDELTTVDRGGTIFSWRADGHADPKVIQAGSKDTEAAYVSADGRWAFVARKNGPIVRAQLDTGALSECQNASRVRSLMADADASVALLGYDETLRFCIFGAAQGHLELLRLDARPLAVWPQDRTGTWLALTETGVAWSVDPRSSRATRLDGWSLSSRERELFGEVKLADRSADEHVLVFASEKQLAVVRAQGGQVTRTLRDITGSPSHVRLSPQGTLLAVAMPGVVSLFRLGETLEALPTIDSRVRFYPVDPEAPPSNNTEGLEYIDLAWSPDERYLATVGGGSGIAVWSLGQGKEPTRYYADAGVDRVIWVPDSSRLATTGDDGPVHVWHSPSQDAKLTFRAPGRVYAGDITTDGKSFAVGTAGADLLIGSVSDARILQQINLRTLAPPCDEPVARSPVVKLIAFDAEQHLWFALDDGVVGRVTMHDSVISEPQVLCSNGRLFAAHRGSSRVAWVDEHGQVSVWGSQAAPVTLDNSLNAHVNDLRFSADGSQLAAVTDGGTLALWDTSGGAIRVTGEWRAHEEPALCVAPDNRPGSVLSTGQDGKANWWTGTNHRHRETIADPQDGKWMETCALDPTRNVGFVASSSGRLWAWNLNQPQEHAAIATSADLAQIGSINTLIVTPDGARLVTGGGLDGKVRIWASTPDYALLSEVAMQSTVTVTAASQKPGYILAAAEDGQVRLLPVVPEDVARILSQRTSATLTVIERQKLLGQDPQDARRDYEESERAQGRTPLPAGWRFEVPL